MQKENGKEKKKIVVKRGGQGRGAPNKILA
jgi:hypothetical protein